MSDFVVDEDPVPSHVCGHTLEVETLKSFLVQLEDTFDGFATITHDHVGHDPLSRVIQGLAFPYTCFITPTCEHWRGRIKIPRIRRTELSVGLKLDHAREKNFHSGATSQSLVKNVNVADLRVGGCQVTVEYCLSYHNKSLEERGDAN